jgi:hypothetical protein
MRRQAETRKVLAMACNRPQSVLGALTVSLPDICAQSLDRLGRAMNRMLDAGDATQIDLAVCAIGVIAAELVRRRSQGHSYSTSTSTSPGGPAYGAGQCLLRLATGDHP